DGADEDPAICRIAVPRARLEQERLVGKGRQRFVEIRALCTGGVLFVVTADNVDARDVAHQLARVDPPRLLWILRDVRLNRGIEVDAPPLVKQGDGSGRQGLGNASKTELRARRHRHAALDVCPSKALGPHDLAIPGDRYRE